MRLFPSLSFLRGQNEFKSVGRAQLDRFRKTSPLNQPRESMVRNTVPNPSGTQYTLLLGATPNTAPFAVNRD